MHGKQSRYLVSNYKLDSFASMVTLFFLALLFFYFYYKNMFSTISGWIAVVLLCTPVVWYGRREFFKYHLSSKFFLKGIRSEGQTWYTLKRLPNTYSVFQDIKIQNGGNIDFIVVGPSGVFTIDAKSHNGKITLENKSLIRNGKPLEKFFLKQAKYQAGISHQYLKDNISSLPDSFFVKPVIVFTGRWANLSFGMIPQESVFVIKIKWLNKLLTEQMECLDNDTIQKIIITLENSNNFISISSLNSSPIGSGII